MPELIGIVGCHHCEYHGVGIMGLIGIMSGQSIYMAGRPAFPSFPFLLSSRSNLYANLYIIPYIYTHIYCLLSCPLSCSLSAPAAQIDLAPTTLSHFASSNTYLRCQPRSL